MYLHLEYLNLIRALFIVVKFIIIRMIPEMLNENDIEDMRRIPVNLELLTLYTYPSHFIL